MTPRKSQDAIEPNTNERIVEIYVQPGASKSALIGRHADAWKIAIAAPPEKGKANAALVAFLSKLLSIPKQSIDVVSGHTSRHKRLRLVLTDRSMADRYQEVFADDDSSR